MVSECVVYVCVCLCVRLGVNVCVSLFIMAYEMFECECECVSDLCVSWNRVRDFSSGSSIYLRVCAFNTKTIDRVFHIKFFTN